MKRDLVVLFYPKTEPDNIYRNLPIPMLKLASQVKANGYRVRVVDSRFEENYASVIRELSGEILCFGVSCMTGYQINHSIKASSIIKKENPKIPIIWGGWHPSLLPEETIQNNFIDIVVRGQGEHALIGIINALTNGLSLDKIPGLTFKDEQDRVVHNPDRAFEDINSFVSVDFGVLDINKYINETPLGRRTIFWNASQGCPYHCGFCCTPTLYRRHWSSLRVDRMLDDIEILIKRFNVDGILFSEDNFFTDKNRVSAFCEGILGRDLKLRWSTDARINQVARFSDEYLSLLRKSGCMKLYLGAESGDQDVLNLIDKEIGVGDTFKAAELLHRNGIIAEFFLMVGFPLNPERDLQKTLQMIGEIKRMYPNHQATPFLYTPYPGTKLFNTAREKGLKYPSTLEGWINWNSLAPITPWVNRRYLEKVNRLIKFYLPFAYPSDSLSNIMRSGWLGLVYKTMHLLAKFRIEKNMFLFPLEWYIVKYLYYKIKLRYNIFKKVMVPR